MGTILGNTHFSIKKCALSFFGHFYLFIGSNISLNQIISSKLYYLISYGKTNSYIKTRIRAKDTQYLLKFFFLFLRASISKHFVCGAHAFLFFKKCHPFKDVFTKICLFFILHIIML